MFDFPRIAGFTHEYNPHFLQKVTIGITENRGNTSEKAFPDRQIFDLFFGNDHNSHV